MDRQHVAASMRLVRQSARRLEFGKFIVPADFLDNIISHYLLALPVKMAAIISINRFFDISKNHGGIKKVDVMFHQHPAPGLKQGVADDDRLPIDMLLIIGQAFLFPA